ncbi:hypothetical protein J6590_093151 [Homalodisca vitripennis]|nr:hypothetical protein J6590_093151 [Homalodisca vitripennis]
MANVGGPRSGRRRLLMSAIQSVLLYGVEMWADALTKEFYRLRPTRRKLTLRAYRSFGDGGMAEFPVGK